jgi:ribosomal protein S14
MLNKKSKLIIKDNLKRSILIKYKYLNLLQKSLFHNRYFSKKKKVLFFYYTNINRISSKKTKNLCLISGEHKAVNKKLVMSRFQINYSSILNNLQNFKINSW